MTTILAMKNKLHTFASSTLSAYYRQNRQYILNLLAAALIIASLPGLAASIIILIAALLGITFFGPHEALVLFVEISLLTMGCALCWIGMIRLMHQTRRREAYLHAILDHVGDGVLALDEQGGFLSANRSLLRMIPEEHLRQMDAPLEDLLRWRQAVFSVITVPVTGAGTVLIFRDETRRHETERAKDALLATVSHELRTPLGAVMNYLELLKMMTQSGKTNPAKFDEYLSRALENSNRLLSLINDIIDQAQLQSGGVLFKERGFNLPILIEKTIRTMESRLKEKDLFYELKVGPNVPVKINGDPEQLQKALVNLISNAIKFTRNGGIRIKVFVTDATTLSISVSDTGPGIPAEQLPDIFETFRRASNYAQREHRGAGLGLSIAKQIITTMGGEISVSSTLGVGSTFTISLPLERLN